MEVVNEWIDGLVDGWMGVHLPIGPFRALYIIGGQRAEFSIWRKDF